jgi:glyoxylase-like metal-dependent hydrolase (beta-lactamase superfamily II)
LTPEQATTRSALAGLPLPPGVQVFERGWLSSNNILLSDPADTQAPATLIDTGFVQHAPQTLALLQAALALPDGTTRPLGRILNTHLHSDHCGGNALLQRHFRDVETLVPPGQADAVRHWDIERLGFHTMSQPCDRFVIQGVVQPGDEIRVGTQCWQAHAAPGHDPHSLIFFEPHHRIALTADALWQRGFGIVFPELSGESGFADTAASLDLIESLQPECVVPGHGAPFTDVAGALAVARNRLARFVDDPSQHAVAALKSLITYYLLQVHSSPRAELVAWALQVPLFVQLRGLTLAELLPQVLDDLVQRGALRQHGAMLQVGSIG